MNTRDSGTIAGGGSNDTDWHVFAPGVPRQLSQQSPRDGRRLGDFSDSAVVFSSFSQVNRMFGLYFVTSNLWASRTLMSNMKAVLKLVSVVSKELRGR